MEEMEEEMEGNQASPRENHYAYILRTKSLKIPHWLGYSAYDHLYSINTLIILLRSHQNILFITITH